MGAVFSFVVAFLITIVDVFLIVSFPWRIAFKLLGYVYTLLLLLGLLIYVLIHLLRKPVAYYVWNHEFSHLIFAKLFFKKISLFQISYKRGGKVAMEKSNVMIDLAPYFFSPFTFGLLLGAVLLNKAGVNNVISLYFLLLGASLGMLFSFDVEAFAEGQEDIRRNGYFLSMSIVIFMFLVFSPLYLVPVMGSPMKQLAHFYMTWLSEAIENAVKYYLLICSLVRSLM